MHGKNIYSEPNQTFILNVVWKLLIIFVKTSIVDIWLDSEYASFIGIPQIPLVVWSFRISLLHV